MSAAAQHFLSVTPAVPGPETAGRCNIFTLVVDIEQVMTCASHTFDMHLPSSFPAAKSVGSLPSKQHMLLDAHAAGCS